MIYGFRQALQTKCFGYRVDPFFLNEICSKWKCQSVAFNRIHCFYVYLPRSDYVTDFARSRYMINIWHLYTTSETDTADMRSLQLTNWSVYFTAFVKNEIENRMNRNTKIGWCVFERNTFVLRYFSFVWFSSDDMEIYLSNMLSYIERIVIIIAFLMNIVGISLLNGVFYLMMKWCINVAEDIHTGSKKQNNFPAEKKNLRVSSCN